MFVFLGFIIFMYVYLFVLFIFCWCSLLNPLKSWNISHVGREQIAINEGEHYPVGLRSMLNIAFGKMSMGMKEN